MDTIPPVSPENKIPGRTSKTGFISGLSALVCAVLAIVLAIIGAGFLIGSLLTLAAVILSIIAIVQKSKAIGITMLILSTILVGPASCVISGLKDENIRKWGSKVGSFFSEQIDQNADIIEEMEKAQKAGDKEKVKQLQKELENRIEKNLKIKWGSERDPD